MGWGLVLLSYSLGSMCAVALFVPTCFAPYHWDGPTICHGLTWTVFTVPNLMFSSFVGEEPEYEANIFIKMVTQPVFSQN